jgi:hypothetical protein
MRLEKYALEAAARAVGSTDLATVAVTAYLNAIEKGVPAPNQPQLPGVRWEDYEMGRNP